MIEEKMDECGMVPRKAVAAGRDILAAYFPMASGVLRAEVAETVFLEMVKAWEGAHEFKSTRGGQALALPLPKEPRT